MDDRLGLDGYAQDALSILNHNLRRYHEGRRESYRVVAAQLRLLLCDTTRQHGQIVDVSLAARLWPDLTFHPLCTGGMPLRFDRDAPRLPRLAWLEQTFTTPGEQPISMRSAIRLVCDRDGGAHVDPPAARPLPDLSGAMIAIGEYVAGEIARKESMIDG